VRRVHKDGSQVFVAVTESPLRDADGTVVGVSVIARDVSAERRAEAALQQSEAEFRQLAEAMPQIVWITRADGQNVYFNQRWMDYTGLAPEESLGGGWTKPFHPEDRQRASDAWQRATATGGSYSLECRLRRLDGAYRWWLIRGLPMRDAAGQVAKWCGTCTDIDDLKLADLATAESERRFAQVFHTSLMAVAILEAPSERMIDVNGRCAEFFGFARDEMIGHTTSELGLWADPADRQRLVAGMAGGSTVRGEAAFRRKDGGTRQALISIETMTHSSGGEDLVLVTLLDTTDQKRLESQFLQSQKMEAVGRLAGGVAHDFNNALGVILGYTELLMPKAGEAQRNKLEQILKATHRATGLTRQLLAFSRKQVVDPKVLDMNVLLADLEKMIGRLLGEDIDIAIVPSANLGQVKADPGQMEQVVVNLCVNARDAMPDGGLLRIETTNVAVDLADPSQHEPMAPGRYVTIAVSDSGCGIEKEMLPKIFEPFFTTKEEGKGTGLGLSMVYGAVKQAGGYVWAYSTVGQGTTFRIYLPRIDEPVETPRAPEAPMPAKGSETILLVEDEGSLMDIAHEILEDHGYRVIQAGGAEEAVEVARRHPDTIHLLLTDVVMPGMNGRALADSLRTTRPGLKVLYMSGYTDDIIAHRGVLEPHTFLLTKPFTTLDLLRRVRDALEGDGAGSVTGPRVPRV
jgi:two-component system, cell cycle sensor histidine kinase and response regulator CckA